MMTIRNFSDVLYSDPHEDVNAMRKALLITPAMFKNCRMLNHVPENNRKY